MPDNLPGSDNSEDLTEDSTFAARSAFCAAGAGVVAFSDIFALILFPQDERFYATGSRG